MQNAMKNLDEEKWSDAPTNEAAGKVSFLTPSAPADATFILFRLPRELRDAVYDKAFALLKLPETIVLRRSRHEELVSRQAMPHTSRNGTPPESPKFPAIVPVFCYINHQTYNESLPIFLRNREVILGSFGTLKIFARFLSRVPERKAFCAVTHLTLEESANSMRKIKRPANFWKSDNSFDNWFADHLLGNLSGLKHVTIRYTYLQVLDREECGEYVRAQMKNQQIDGKERMSFDMVGRKLAGKEEVMERLTPTVLLTLPRLKSVTMICIGGDTFAHAHGIATQQVFAHLTDSMQEEKATRGATWELDVKYLHEDGVRELPACMGWATG